MDKKTKVLLTGLGAFSFMHASSARAMNANPCVSSLIQVTAITTPLDFGSLDCTAGAGTVAINANNGAVTPTGCIAAVGGAPGRAQVRVIGGQANGGIKIRVSIFPTTRNINNGAANLTVTGIALNKGVTFTQNGNQTRTLGVGGTANIDSTDPGGTYTGTVTVSAVCL